MIRHPRTAAPAFVVALLLGIAACAPQQGDDASSSAADSGAVAPAASEAARESAEPSDASETPYEYEY